MKHPYNNDRREWAFIRIENIPTPFVRQVPNSGYQYKYNGKEWQDELNLNLYDYGARNYDPALGRWMNVDPLTEKAYSWSPFRYCFDNPVIFLDKNGLYETDGHYWTVYLAGLVTGRKDAYSLAYWAEEPDNIMSFFGDIAYATNTWMYPKNQQEWHALTGGNPTDERNKSRQMFINANNVMDRGRALHRLGDSYSHTREGTPRMFGKLIGHALLGTAPDKIANRPQLYLEYVKDLISTLGGSNETDMFTFNYIANAGTSSEENMAILKTEVRIREGVNTFSVSGNHKSTIDSYLKNRETKYGKISAKIMTAEADVYKLNSETGEFEKTGTETRTFVIFN
jgi:RHS repeat-associated protein